VISQLLIVKIAKSNQEMLFGYITRVGSKSENDLCLLAPSQAPGNIEWNLTNSKVFLNWEHVKAMDNESEVTGYKVFFFLRSRSSVSLLINMLYQCAT